MSRSTRTPGRCSSSPITATCTRGSGRLHRAYSTLSNSGPDNTKHSQGFVSGDLTYLAAATRARWDPLIIRRSFCTVVVELEFTNTSSSTSRCRNECIRRGSRLVAGPAKFDRGVQRSQAEFDLRCSTTCSDVRLLHWRRRLGDYLLLIRRFDSCPDLSTSASRPITWTFGHETTSTPTSMGTAISSYTGHGNSRIGLHGGVSISRRGAVYRGSSIAGPVTLAVALPPGD